jgi:hypothetical protein
MSPDMREIISQLETYYIKRRIAPIIREIADSLPVVVITGARQVGKSTTARGDSSVMTGGMNGLITSSSDLGAGNCPYTGYRSPITLL